MNDVFGNPFSKVTHKTLPMPTDNRDNFYLISGEIVFVHKDDDVPTAVRCNTVVNLREARFPMTQIARMQQSLQLSFHQQNKDAGEAKIINVVIMNIMPLGKFTMEEFNVPPPGMKMVEKVS